ncbi:YdcF family protein [Streptomyces beijiangensis]|uniref:YdcF family protein n=2 Tax=Streptomyces beijiangensis TaxID=163361 RepID=A0A939F2Y9_9ACTN|nr:YdcF family protein [Streptomyces beijiangensis]
MWGAAAVFLVLFAVGVWREPRRLRNAVLLGLALACVTLDVVGRLGEEHGRVVTIAAYVLLVLPVVSCVLLAGVLIANGCIIVRKEGRSLSHLLSLMAGIAMLTALALTWAAVVWQNRDLSVPAEMVLLVGGYLSFLFVCFLLYGFLYTRLPPRRDAAFVVVLGSGLIGGSRVSPLLAGRLDQGRRVFERLERSGRRPLLITSGGQGPDELLPEAEAMAGYLTRNGFPADRLRIEDRSRTTEENLRNSRALMQELRPEASCVIVTSNYHAFRAALMARKTGVQGTVVGARTAAYFWPSATLREFAALLSAHRTVNACVCAVLLLPPLAAWWRG